MTNLRKLTLLEKAWLILLLLTLICLGVSRVFREESRFIQKRHEMQTRNESSTSSSPSTKSLNQLEGRNNHVSDHVLFYNRVPKAGSSMMVLLLHWLQGINGFRHTPLHRGNRRRLVLSEQESLVEEVWRIIRKEAVPVSFDKHVYFTNFTLFDKQPPTFINLLRDPADKAVSRFYYARVTPNPLNPDIRFARYTVTRKPKIATFEQCLQIMDPECNFYSGQPYDLAIPYFCGHEQQCMILNDRWALARAKKHIEQFFPVVGVLEELNATLLVLEKKLPLFFRGITDLYYNQLLEPHKNKNALNPRSVDFKVRKKLESQLETEYDLYYWVKARLLQQANDT